MPVRAVDLVEARSHEPGELEERDARGDRERRVRVPQAVGRPVLGRKSPQAPGKSRNRREVGMFVNTLKETAVIFRLCRCGSWERNPPCVECVERERLKAECRSAQSVKGKARR